MKTTRKSKIWLGVGAFALIQAAGMAVATTPAQAADGTCGWERSGENGRWHYDGNCERGERYVGNRPGGYYNDHRYHNNHGPRYNERGERWNDRDHRWERGDNRNGRDRWGERG